jgi:hypothetical protein
MIRSMHIYATKACDMVQLGYVFTLQTAQAILVWNGDEFDEIEGPSRGTEGARP